MPQGICEGHVRDGHVQQVDDAGLRRDSGPGLSLREEGFTNAERENTRALWWWIRTQCASVDSRPHIRPDSSGNSDGEVNWRVIPASTCSPAHPKTLFSFPRVSNHHEPVHRKTEIRPRLWRRPQGVPPADSGEGPAAPLPGGEPSSACRHITPLCCHSGVSPSPCVFSWTPVIGFRPRPNPL